MATVSKTAVPKGRNLPKGWLKDPSQSDPGGVEAARQEMIEAAEPFVSKSGRVIQPTFQANPANKGRKQATASTVAAANQDFAPEGNPAAAAVSRRAVEVPSRVASAPVQLEQAPAPAHVAAPAAEVVEERHADTNPTKEAPKVIDIPGVGNVRIYREGSDWCSEIYDNTSLRTQVFRASSIMDLLAKVSVAQVHATKAISVRNAQIRKAVNPELESSLLAKVYASSGLSAQQFDAQSVKVKQALVNAQVNVEIVDFANQHLNYFGSQKNGELLTAYLNKNGWPITAHNLSLAYDAVQHKLDAKPGASVETPSEASVSISESAAAPVAAPSALTIPAPVTPVPAPAPTRKRGTYTTTGLQPTHGQGMESGGTSPAHDDIAAQAAKQARSMPLADLQKSMRQQAAQRQQGKQNKTYLG